MNYLNPGQNLNSLRDSLYEEHDRLLKELKKPGLTESEKESIYNRLASIESRLP